MVYMLKLGNSDDVAVALQPVAAEQFLADLQVTTLSDIPAGHKIALRALATGQPVRKSSQIIGFATHPIVPGEHVHTHNLVTGNFERDYSIGSEACPTEFVAPSEAATFRGIVRHDGRVATRNYVGILTTVNCSATVARRIAAHFTPAVLLLGLGCETNQIDSLVTLTGPASTLRTSTIQEEGGTAPSIQKGIATIFEMLEQANNVTRTAVSASNLVMGLQCGGSDAY